MKGEGCPRGICSLAGSSKSSTTLRFLVLLLGLEKQHLFMLQVLVKQNSGPIFSGNLHRIYARKKGYFWFKKKKEKTNQTENLLPFSVCSIFSSLRWEFADVLCGGVQVLLITFYPSLFHVGLQCGIQNNSKKTSQKNIVQTTGFFPYKLLNLLSCGYLGSTRK